MVDYSILQVLVVGVSPAVYVPRRGRVVKQVKRVRQTTLPFMPGGAFVPNELVVIIWSRATGRAHSSCMGMLHLGGRCRICPSRFGCLQGVDLAAFPGLSCPYCATVPM